MKTRLLQFVRSLSNVATIPTLAIFLAFPLVFPGQVAAEACRMKIGAMFPLTGPASLIGERSQQAAQLALEELPPELRERITILYEDTEMKAAVGFRAAQSLLRDPEVTALTGFGSEMVTAISALVETKRVPGIYVTPDRRPIIGKQQLFRHWVDGKDMLEAILPEMRKRGVRKIALVYSEIPAMTRFGEELRSSVDKLDLTIAYQSNVLPSETDLRSLAQAAVAQNPDAIFFFLLPPQTSIFMKQLRSLNRDLPVFTYINVENSHEVEAAQGALEGVIYSGPVFEDPFVSRFIARFHEYPEFASGNIYDIVRIYAAALASGACTRKEFRTYISALKSFSGVLGEYGVEDGNDFRFPVRAKVIEEGSFRFLR